MSEYSPEPAPRPALPNPHASQEYDWLRLSVLHDEGEKSSVQRDSTGSAVPPSSLSSAEVWDARSSSSRETRLDSAPSIPGYQILGVLGRSGMGLVYKARQAEPNRIVALIWKTGSGDPAADLAAMRAKAKTMAPLRHRHVVTVYDIQPAVGGVYMTMEFAEGGSLAQAAARLPQPPDFAVKIVQALALALQDAHDQGFIHYDLKPGNVILDGFRRPKLIHFGAAQRRNSDLDLASPTELLDSCAYQSPEQIAQRTERLTPSANIYSLGAILYELLTGRPPFQATSSALTREQILTADPLLPTAVQPGISADLETVVLKCLRKSPAERYASASALADDLQRVQDGKPVTALRFRHSTPLGEMLRRNAGPALIGMSVIILMLAGGVVSVWQRGARAERRMQQTTVLLNALHDAESKLEIARRAPEGDLTAWQEPRIAANQVGELASTTSVNASLQNRIDDLLHAVTQGEEQARRRADQLARETAARARITAIRLRQPVMDPATRSPRTIEQLYELMFQDLGMDVATTPATDVFQRIAESPLHEDLESAYLEWAVLHGKARSPAEFDAMGTAKFLANTDPHPWRSKLWTALAAGKTSEVGVMISQGNQPSRSAALLVGASRLLQHMGFAHEAIELLGTAERLHPSDFFSVYELAWQLHHERHARLSEAETYYHVAQALAPDLMAVSTQLGFVLAQQGRHEDGIYWLRSVIDAQPTSAQAYCDLAMVLTSEGKLADAILEYRQALKRDLKSVRAWRGLAAVFLKQGRRNEAIDTLRLAVQEQPRDFDSLRDLGNALRSRQQYDEAETYLRRALAVDPHSSWIHHDLALTLWAQDQRTEAERLLKKATSLDPEEPEFWYLLDEFQSHR